MNDKKSIIIYFSRADENYFSGEMKYIDKGNTEVIAEYIKDITNADIFKVEPLNPYPVNYNECIKEAKIRTENHNAPIKQKIDISPYKIIYIGTPIYWSGMPEELFTALKGLDYKGKIIKPFVTHEGSGLALVPNQLKEICEGAQINPGLAIIGSQVNNSKEKVLQWI